jgi:hypothetical protein
MLNHLNTEQSCWGEEMAAGLAIASLMVGSLANQFSIPEECVSIEIIMRRLKDGTLH